MRTDEYGQPLSNRGWSIKVNLTRCWEAWRKIWGPRKSDIGERLKKAKRDDAEWEMLWSKPSGDRK